MKRINLRQLFALFAVFTLMSVASAASVTPWPLMPDLPRAKVAWVAKDVWVNGVPSRIQQFDSSLSPQAVLAHYRAHWKTGESGPAREGQHGEWALISALHGPFQMVVQVKADGTSGSKGLISTMNIRELKSNYVPSDWPRNSLLSLVQVMESIDGPNRSFYMTATSDKRPEHVAEHLKNSWLHSGWRLQNEVSDAATYLASFERNGMTLDMVVTRSGQQAHVVVNFVQFVKS